jgi:GTP pyrophosphokinase
MVIPGRFRDYISTPKSNGYQSLHTSVIGPLDKRIEIQIRTKKMHKISEYGIAAHWNYKETTGFDASKKKNYKWLRSMVKILDESSGFDEFLENSKNEMLSGQIFCISPKGKIIVLPKEATALDFAYAIHSEVGNHAIGAKINGTDSQLEATLANGDQVEIITDQNSFPKYSWFDHIVTIKAKTNIRKAIEETYFEKITSLGKELMGKFIEKNHLTISEEDYEKIICALQCGTKDRLYHAIGIRKKTPKEVALFHKSFKDNAERNDRATIDGIHETSSEMIIFPTNCCSPVPRDKIVGVQLNEDSLIEIHTRECQVMKSKVSSGLYRITEIQWSKEAFNSSAKYPTRLSITTKNLSGNLSKISTAIEREGGTILNIKTGEESGNFVKTSVDVLVRDLPHLRCINAALRNCDFVVKVERN